LCLKVGSRALTAPAAIAQVDVMPARHPGIGVAEELADGEEIGAGLGK